MKFTQFLLGFIAASLVFMMISATNPEKQSDDPGQYHMANNGNYYLYYDSNSGDFVEVNLKGKVYKQGNIKTELQKQY